MSKKDIKKIARIMANRANYVPHPLLIKTIINNLESTDVDFMAGRITLHFNLNLIHTNRNAKKWLKAYTPLGLLLLIYQPDYDESINLLLRKGAKLRDSDICILIGIAEKINKSVLEALFRTYDSKLTTPLIEGENIFHLFAMQPFINEYLIDFIFDRGLDPAVEYEGQKSGVSMARECRNHSLLNYYYKKGISECNKNESNTISPCFANLNNESRDPGLTEKPAPDEFEKEVKEFKNNYKIKSLRRWLNINGQSSIAPNYSFFLANRTIGTFLCRDNIETDKFIPKYPKHEISFYSGTSKLFHIPFRNDGGSLSVAESKITKSRAGASKATILTMMKKLSQELPAKNKFMLIFPEDTYDLSEQLELLCKLKNPDKDRYFYIFSLTIKDEHILATLSIIDVENEKILFHILINSWKNSEYTNYLKMSINYQQSHNDNNHASNCVPEVYDASISVQTHDADANCSSCSIEITRALYLSLFKNNLLLSELEDFCGNNDRKLVWEQLKLKIQNEIQANLPMFFDTTADGFSLKSRDDILNWHIQNRFRYGRDCIENLRKDAIKTIEDNYNNSHLSPI